ncbi:hypothetical protein CDAR_532591 [Caerostris darwini]|uniref:Uncharacterized protein n=1 Tax=Caerostris darwini TaxID=1538125 RepID=A0AAV4VXN5_9ARAC|nr:hypothetical protein CDAR_532591 [Caerostris darwini]
MNILLLLGSQWRFDFARRGPVELWYLEAVPFSVDASEALKSNKNGIEFLTSSLTFLLLEEGKDHHHILSMEKQIEILIPKSGSAYVYLLCTALSDH